MLIGDFNGKLSNLSLSLAREREREKRLSKQTNRETGKREDEKTETPPLLYVNGRPCDVV